VLRTELVHSKCRRPSPKQGPKHSPIHPDLPKMRNFCNRAGGGEV
jgi:hypothetical protein